MKQYLIFIFSLFLGCSAVAQKLESYVQFSLGHSLNEKNSYMLQAEYGKTYKWLDVGLSLDYESAFTAGSSHRAIITVRNDGSADFIKPQKDFSNTLSVKLSLNARVDLIKLFVKNSKHSFTIGGGLGYRLHQLTNCKSEYLNSDIDYALSSQTEYEWFGSIRASYEYAITQKLRLGAFFYGSEIPALGMSIRRNF
ncbi:MAG: hypothetical protein LBS01_00525 [Prevotellaceae bacterium]|jgi:hypothetical protein|nr:hypothetical protein [Prevotellaceae bacterium]